MRIRSRVTPPEIAPNVAPFLPAVRAPIAVAIPAVAPTINASFFQERRLPPPHRTSFGFIFITLSRDFFRLTFALGVPQNSVGNSQISQARMGPRVPNVGNVGSLRGRSRL